MTQNQIKYQAHLEAQRANLRNEALQQERNVETQRANLASEDIRDRQLAESQRQFDKGRWDTYNTTILRSILGNQTLATALAAALGLGSGAYAASALINYLSGKSSSDDSKLISSDGTRIISVDELSDLIKSDRATEDKLQSSLRNVLSGIFLGNDPAALGMNSRVNSFLDQDAFEYLQALDSGESLPSIKANPISSYSQLKVGPITTVQSAQKQKALFDRYSGSTVRDLMKTVNPKVNFVDWGNNLVK